MCILMLSVGEIVSNSQCLCVSCFPSDAQNRLCQWTHCVICGLFFLISFSVCTVHTNCGG
jgi:hypothetical protein